MLIFSQFYLPGFIGGGPIRSIASIVENLGDEFDFYIVTSDHDLNAEAPYDAIELGAWNRVGKANVFYLPAGIRSFFMIAKILRETSCDMLYLNSFFSTKFTIWPLLLAKLRLVPNKPVLLAPRGEFSEAALGLKSLRKRIFRKLSSAVGMYANLYWHASTSAEKEDVARNYGVGNESILTSRVLVASDMAAIRSDDGSLPAAIADSAGEGGIRVCFLSRIAPMKNLEFALRVLADVQVPVVFNIYGPREDMSYWESCQNAINALPAHVTVHYGGPVAADKVVKTISRHDLLILPTLGENFGHVFVEAWSAGVPVLASDRTPWRGLSDRNLGWDISLDNRQSFIDAIHQVAKWSAVERAQIRSACQQFAREIISDGTAIESNRNLFLTVMGKNSL